MQKVDDKENVAQDEPPSKVRKSRFWKSVKIESEKERKMLKKNKLLNFLTAGGVSTVF